MFRRDSNGDAVRFQVVGLWGSGNVVADQEGVLQGDYTAYTMWDGHALFGPGRPGSIEKFPALVATLEVDEFLARYTPLGDRCELWSGGEVLGVGCVDACAAAAEGCPELAPETCAKQCARVPRAVVGCVTAADSCEAHQECLDTYMGP